MLISLNCRSDRPEPHFLSCGVRPWRWVYSGLAQVCHLSRNKRSDDDKPQGWRSSQEVSACEQCWGSGAWLSFFFSILCTPLFCSTVTMFSYICLFSDIFVAAAMLALFLYPCFLHACFLRVADPSGNDNVSVEKLSLCQDVQSPIVLLGRSRALYFVSTILCFFVEYLLYVWRCVSLNLRALALCFQNTIWRHAAWLSRNVSLCKPKNTAYVFLDLCEA